MRTSIVSSAAVLLAIAASGCLDTGRRHAPLGIAERDAGGGPRVIDVYTVADAGGARLPDMPPLPPRDACFVDGATRDCVPEGAAVVAERGACHLGTQRCKLDGADFGRWTECEGAVGPRDESCGPGLFGNGVDDDCDGQVDEGCCVRETQERTTGATEDGATVCCGEGQHVVSLVDCGSGEGHWARTSGDSCAEAHASPGDPGGACVRITCEGVVCPDAAPELIPAVRIEPDPGA